MEYFKHYADAGEGKLVNLLIDKFGLNGYAWWFLLVELCSQHWDGKSEPKFSFFQTIVKKKLRISYKKLEVFLGFCSENSNVLYSFSEKIIEIEMPNLLEIKTSRNVIKSNKKQLPVYIDKNRLEENIYIADDLISFWNSKNLNPVESNPSALREVINGINFQLNQNSRGIDKIKSAIVNYALVYLGKDYFYTHKFSLEDFLRKKTSERFFENFNAEDLKSFESKKSQGNSEIQETANLIFSMVKTHGWTGANNAREELGEDIWKCIYQIADWRALCERKEFDSQKLCKEIAQVINNKSPLKTETLPLPI